MGKIKVTTYLIPRLTPVLDKLKSVSLGMRLVDSCTFTLQMAVH